MYERFDNTGISRRNVLKQGAVVTAGVGLGVGTVTGHKGKLDRQLAEARSATAVYNDPANAYEDGYFATDHHGNRVELENVQEEALAICGMGYHFIHPDIIGAAYGGAEPDRERPPILVYGVGDDDLVLGAVEYLAQDPAPDLFHGDDDQWVEWPPDTDLYALHAWVHNNNPEGVFNPTNPRELFHPEGCHGH